MPIKDGNKVLLSYSAYSVYKQCPLKYKREKVLREKVPDEDVTFTLPGTIIHNAVEHFLKTGNEEIFSPSVLKSAIKNYSEKQGYNIEKGYSSIEKFENMVISWAENIKTFLLVENVRSKSFLSEAWFGDWENPLMFSSNLGTQGAADLIIKTETGVGVLYDYKATWSTKNLNIDQLLLYAIASEIKFGIPIGMAGFYLIPKNKTEFYTFTKEMKEDLLSRLQTAANDILDSKFEPCPSEKCKYCQYLNSCEASKNFSKENPKILSSYSGMEIASL